MGRADAMFWLPTFRFGRHLVELTRAQDCKASEIYTAVSVPRHCAVRYSRINAARMVEPGEYDELPAVVFETWSNIISVAFMPFIGSRVYSLEERMAALPACREFYAQLVREMGRDGD